MGGSVDVGDLPIMWYGLVGFERVKVWANDKNYAV